MKDPVKEWLPVRLNHVGVLACGLRRPNGKLHSQCSDASCPPAAMDNLLRQLDGSRTLFTGPNLPPKWVTFHYEHGQIRFVTRPDGWYFAVVVRPETDAAAQLDSLSVEFISLQLGK
ncbi:MAG: hypothetical protein P4N60_16010 [Verrucomicrobiae bacterium]|nr:hypothetical protein [Verrucomicrobiae bacterium]